MDQVSVLQRAREERSRRGDLLQRGAVVAEADDHRTRIEVAESFEQQVDALVADQLAEVEDRGLVAREELGEALGVSAVGEALVAGSVTASLVDEPFESS